MLEFQNPKYDFDYDDEERIETVETVRNPADYDLHYSHHVKHISALRKTGKIERLRDARKAMNQLFPLTPAMWQEWIKDEMSLKSESDAFDAIEKLYKRAVSDYLSVPLWCDYLKFVEDGDPLDCRSAHSGIKKLRSLFECALTVVGLHISEGCKVWEAYRKYEQQLLDDMDKTDIKAREKQVQRIRNIFQRQLNVPHKDLEFTLLTYKSWEAEQGTNIDVTSGSLGGIDAATFSAYQKAHAMFKTRVHLEELVSKKDSNDNERLQKYMMYLELEQASGLPPQIFILYECAISEFPRCTNLWLNYTKYLDRKSEWAQSVTDVYYRATRNCPWDGELWARYLLALERIQSSEEHIAAVFEKSLRCTFSSSDEYLNLFLTRVDGLRRRIPSTGEGGITLEYALIRDTFLRASGYLSPQLNNTESLLRVYSYWAQLEFSLGRNIDAARDVWDTLVACCGSMCKAWEDYIAMEIEAGHINKARSLYKRCYNRSFLGTGSKDICKSWIQFEREFGTLQDLYLAVHNLEQNPKSELDSVLESDSDDEDAVKRIQTLERELNRNPAVYDLHLQYIRALRLEAEIEKLGAAREAMSQLFPLTPAMWQEWINDELSLKSKSDAFNAIEKLYERGVSDYLSVSLWCEYLNFVKAGHPLDCRGAPGGINKLRDLFERALSATGLHISEGWKVWEAYRNFEQQLLDHIDKTDIKAREKQVQRIRKIFQRQLTGPHKDLEFTLLTYKSWEAEQGTNGIDADTFSAYQKACAMFTNRVYLEELVSRKDSNDYERVQEYMVYLKIEESSGDPALVEILYERAITSFPICTDLWLKYTKYLDRKLECTQSLTDVYYRATRNCPCNGELWARYLLALERIQSSEKDISAVFEKSLTCTFSSSDEYLNLFLTRVDGLRRRILSAGEGGTTLEYARIRNTFQRASSYLSQLNGTESLFRVHSYWAHLEFALFKNIDEARAVWNTLLDQCGSMCKAWTGYIAMEIEAGHVNNARSLYKKCYKMMFFGTGSEDICNSWIRFEREFGTLEDLYHAVQQVTPRLIQLQLFRSHLEST